ncbi:MAG: alcohol dehydrogenase [Rhodobacteraceae bacterium HLUCCA12]|nr:MAG: alcohol dehydrogenase [Rhodobacteraceae bacterium HLUCCA12]
MPELYRVEEARMEDGRHPRLSSESAGSETWVGASTAFAMSFVWQGAATRVVQGENQLRLLGDHCQSLGMKRILFLSSPSVAASKAGSAVVDFLGERIVARLDSIPPHSGEEAVANGVHLARNAAIDGVVALGGGSVSDTAKAILIVLAEGGDIADHANIFYPPDRYDQKILARPKLPLLVIPTTASAAEVTPGLGIRARNGHKLVFWDVNVVPRIIILDPEAYRETPVGVLASTGMNAFAHCVEGLYSRVRNPVSSALALHAARGLFHALPAMIAEPAVDRYRMTVMAGAHLSGHVIANARVGLHHAICHGLGSHGGLGHGEANAIMLPHVMRYNASVAGPELAQLAEAMGIDVRGKPEAQSALAAIDLVVDLQHHIGVPRRLRDLGFDRDKIAAIARMTLSDRGAYFNPRPAPPAEDIAAVIEAAW